MKEQSVTVLHFLFNVTFDLQAAAEKLLNKTENAEIKHMVMKMSRRCYNCQAYGSGFKQLLSNFYLHDIYLMILAIG